MTISMMRFRLPSARERVRGIVAQCCRVLNIIEGDWSPAGVLINEKIFLALVAVDVPCSSSRIPLRESYEGVVAETSLPSTLNKSVGSAWIRSADFLASDLILRS